MRIWTNLAVASVLLVLLSAFAGAQEDLPAGADGAHDRLNNSPRHGEWVKVETGGGDVVNAWLVYPERDDKGPDGGGSESVDNDGARRLVRIALGERRLRGHRFLLGRANQLRLRH